MALLYPAVLDAALLGTGKVCAQCQSECLLDGGVQVPLLLWSWQTLMAPTQWRL